MAGSDDHHAPASQPIGQDFEARFGVMLHPIRDLSKNWMVDLSSYLQEYLDQFVQNSESSPETGSLNFAQAALLIQGSANIYSKKVEYLFNIYTQFYQLVINPNKNKQQQQPVDNEGRESTVDASIHEQYLSLDDITIPSDSNKRPGGHPVSNQAQRTSIPSSFIMLDEQEKGNNMLFNTKGVEMGNRNDTSLNKCRISNIGCLLNNSKQDDQDLINVHALLLEERLPELNDHNMDDQIEFEDDYQDHGNDGVEPEEPPPVELVVGNPQERQPRTTNTIENFFKAINPHQESDLPVKPLKSMCVHRLPESLVKKSRMKKRKKRQNDSVEEDDVTDQSDSATLVPIDVNVLNDICFSNASKFPRNRLKVPLQPSMHDLYWTRRKEHMKLLAEKNKERRALNVDVNELSYEEEPGSDDFPLEPASDHEANEAVGLGILPIDRDSNNRVNNDDAFFGSQDPIPVATTYEELAKEHIARLLENNEKYNRGTDISKRVNEWEEKIQPYLEEEETRRPYDIHAYGSEILAAFGDNNRKQTLPFSNIVRSKRTWEVSRYFLSALLLANSYNVEITANGVLDEAIDTMALTLLSRKRHHEGLEEFQAPSTRK